jgi:hypothetical protein
MRHGAGATLTSAEWGMRGDERVGARAQNTDSSDWLLAISMGRQLDFEEKAHAAAPSAPS